MARKRNSARRNGAKARQAVSANRPQADVDSTQNAGAEDPVVTPPTSPTSASPAEKTDLIESVGIKGTHEPMPLVEQDERTDWQALLPTVSGSSMFEVTPEKVLGEQPRRATDAMASSLSQEMQQTLWNPVTCPSPDRPVSPVLNLGSTVWSVDTDHQQHEMERLKRQQQEQQRQNEMQMQLQQRQDWYYFYQQQQLQQHWQFYYQQQQQQQEHQQLMMPPSPVMAQYPIAASA